MARLQEGKSPTTPCRLSFAALHGRQGTEIVSWKFKGRRAGVTTPIESRGSGDGRRRVQPNQWRYGMGLTPYLTVILDHLLGLVTPVAVSLDERPLLDLSVASSPRPNWTNQGQLPRKRWSSPDRSAPYFSKVYKPGRLARTSIWSNSRAQHKTPNRVRHDF